MSIPSDFEHAYRSLVELVGQLSRTEVPAKLEVSHPVVDEKVDQWKHADCRGAATLAEAAIKALQYDLASRGLKEGAGSVEKDLQALGRIEAIVSPPAELDGPSESTGSTKPAIVEVALPDQLREKMPEGRGFRMDDFQILFEPHEGPSHGHLSVSHPYRYPAFEELRAAAHAPGGPPPNLWALIPKPRAVFTTTAQLTGIRSLSRNLGCLQE